VTTDVFRQIGQKSHRTKSHNL